METRVWESGRLGQPPLLTLPLPGKPPLTACFFECPARHAERLLPKLAPNRLSVDRLKVSPRQPTLHNRYHGDRSDHYD